LRPDHANLVEDHELGVTNLAFLVEGEPRLPQFLELGSQASEFAH
jgi:hypothetical protein